MSKKKRNDSDGSSRTRRLKGLSLSERIRSFDDNLNSTKIPPAVGLLFVLVGLGAAYFILFDSDSGGRRVTTEQEPSGRTAWAGDVTTLQSGNEGDIPVAVTKEFLDRVKTLSRAEDLVGIKQMVLAGQVWTVRHGTKCRVIQRDGFTIEVRILEGPYARHSGFVARRHVASIVD